MTPSSPRSIAIVDDDQSVRNSLRRLCEVFGFTVTTHASGHEFLASLNGGGAATDCLLVDAHMPEMTGFELQRHLVASGVHIPTIVFTADDTAAMAGRPAPGVVAYLRKPSSADELLSAIERAVDRKRP